MILEVGQKLNQTQETKSSKIDNMPPKRAQLVPFHVMHNSGFYINHKTQKQQNC